MHALTNIGKGIKRALSLSRHVHHASSNYYRSLVLQGKGVVGKIAHRPLY